MNKEIHKIKKKKKVEFKNQAILDSTKGSKHLLSFYKKPTCAIYTLHRQHGQSLGILFFIWF